MRTATGLSRERVVDAAVGLIDDQGLLKFSMRKLAATLDVKVMSLYTYVDGIEDVLGEVAGRHVADLQLPPPAPDWQQSVVHMFVDLHARMARHPVLARVFATQPVDSAPAHDFAEAVLSVLVANGFDHDSAVELFIALGSLTTGYALNGQTRNPGSASRLGNLEALPADRYPTLRSAARSLMSWRAGGLADALARLVETHPRTLAGP